MKAKIEIVILNWNGEGHLRTFLPSVLANTPADARITVADNGSTDSSVRLLEKEFPAVNIIRLDSNYGFAEGYNRALSSPCFDSADYFVLLNSDVETPGGWLEPLARYMEGNADTAAAAPKILSYTNRDCFEYAGASGGFIDRLGYPFCRGRILSTLEKDSGQYDDPREVFWATGACMIVRAKVFRDMGGFDGTFFAHMEEIDFCWRSKLAGWKIAVVPSSFVYHLGGGTLRAGPGKLYLNYRNSLYMLSKNLPSGVRRKVVRNRMVADGLSAAVYILTFRWKSFGAVLRAHRAFRKARPYLDTENSRLSPSLDIRDLTGVYDGSIILRYVLGKKTFRSMI